jgi:hypothetical protein
MRDNVEKYGAAGQNTNDKVVHALCWLPNTTNTL